MVGDVQVAEVSEGQRSRARRLAIAIYQNWLYEMNREWRFTDGTLCVLWCVEFPDANSDYPEKRHYIASTRNDYNKGTSSFPRPTFCGKGENLPRGWARL